ncbi:hypothetical protein pipiens_019742 [Culex pipiens pipiens]|uniref:Uncharacterized protein n=1 Tax=Culex pipiens pipiens TaxID=38569 RepID=A0ABD1DS95_CULPP
MAICSSKQHVVSTSTVAGTSVWPGRGQLHAEPPNRRAMDRQGGANNIRSQSARLDWLKTLEKLACEEPREVGSKMDQLVHFCTRKTTSSMLKKSKGGHSEDVVQACRVKVGTGLLCFS